MANTEQPVLIYDRIGANRRNTFLLLFVFVALLAGASIALGIVLGLPYPFAPLLIIPFLIIALVMYYRSPQVALAISQAREVTKDEDGKRTKEYRDQLEKTHVAWLAWADLQAGSLVAAEPEDTREALELMAKAWPYLLLLLRLATARLGGI